MVMYKVVSEDIIKGRCKEYNGIIMTICKQDKLSSTFIFVFSKVLKWSCTDQWCSLLLDVFQVADQCQLSVQVGANVVLRIFSITSFGKKSGDCPSVVIC